MLTQRPTATCTAPNNTRNKVLSSALLSLALLASNDGMAVSGGQQSDIKDAPWMASLLVDGEWVCSGALTQGPSGTSQHVLTTASCLAHLPNKAIQVRLGSNDPTMEGTIYDVVMSSLHEDWYVPHRLNDIAILKLDRPVDSSLASGLKLNRQAEAETAATTLIGWGQISEQNEAPNYLYKVTLQSTSEAVCEDAYHAPVDGQTSICVSTANGQGACQYDQGAPLLKDDASGPLGDTLVGLTSTLGAKCASNMPIVFTRVRAYIPWIEDKMDM